MTTPTPEEEDPAPLFREHLRLYVGEYTQTRAAMGYPVTDKEMISGVLSLLASVISAGPTEEYRARVLRVTHEALDASLSMEVPGREKMN